MTTKLNNKSGPKEDEYMRLHDVLRYTKIGKTTIYRWITDGKFPSPIKAGTRISLWRRGEIDKVMQQLEDSSRPISWERNKTGTYLVEINDKRCENKGRR